MLDICSKFVRPIDQNSLGMLEEDLKRRLGSIDLKETFKGGLQT